MRVKLKITLIKYLEYYFTFLVKIGRISGEMNCSYLQYFFKEANYK